MAELEEIWKPGSFTKNFSWGRGIGLRRLHEAIRIGFDNRMADVPRELFRRRLEGLGRPDYIPANFFLFNKVHNGSDFVVADELVFQALSYDHSAAFDKLALFAFNFTYAGIWIGAAPEQRRPALWAHHYVRDRVARQLKWNTNFISAKDIESFVAGDVRYKAKSAGKLSTNLNYLYNIGGLLKLNTSIIERWWADSAFLALDRIINDREIDGRTTPESRYRLLLSQAGFAELSGAMSLEKDLALGHLTVLYTECGGRDRFSDDFVRERTSLKLPDVEQYLHNDQRPQGAIHPTNARILKTIPRACAMLARYSAGFDIIEADELINFDPESYARAKTREALAKIRARGNIADISVEELMKITRE